jgi:hypothetical protein
MKQMPIVHYVLFAVLVSSCGGTALSSSGSDNDASTRPPGTDAVAPPPGNDATSTDTQPIACVDPVVGAPCTPRASTPCSQPANPCKAGYIWSCNNGTAVWVQELVQCFTPTGKITTAACGEGEVLFVNDVAGDPCTYTAEVEAGTDGSTTGCPNGKYLFAPHCCYSPTEASCVPAPAACSHGLTCGCSQDLCLSWCSGAPSQVACTNAGNSVVDCLCGKG